MKLVVVSDTHGNLKGLRRVVSEVIGKEAVDLFIHLGDDYDDASVFDEFACEYVRVPGVFSDYYLDKSIPNRLIKEFEGWTFLLTHTESSHSNDLPDDIKPEEVIAKGEVDVVLYGHTHKPDATVKNQILFVNPGHLKDEDKKGFPPTYAVIDVTPETIDVKIFEAKEGRIFKEVVFRGQGCPRR